MMRAHSSLSFILLTIKNKDKFSILSLGSITFIQKNINSLKVVHDPVNFLLHLHTLDFIHRYFHIIHIISVFNKSYQSFRILKIETMMNHKSSYIDSVKID